MIPHPKLNQQQAGAFVISLDFELHWGVHDVFALEAYRNNLLGARTVIPKLLRLFEERQVPERAMILQAFFGQGRRKMGEAAEAPES